MDQELNTDYGRRPGQYQDFDKQLAEAVAAFERMPLEVHHRHDEEMRQFMIENGYEGVLGESKKSALVLDDESQRAAVAQAVKESTAEELARAQSPDGDKSLSAATGQETGTETGQATAGAAATPRKPSSIESALAAIQLSPKRQDRLVISGDPLVERAFYDRLARDGKVFYSGGQPIIATSHKDAIEYLNKASQEIHGKDALHAASMNFDRQGSGILGGLKAEVLNRLGRFDRTNVFVVGDEATRSEKLKELGGLLTEMEKKGFVSSSNLRSGDQPGFQLEDGKLVVPKDGPVTLARGNDIYDMVSMAKNTVQSFNLHEAERNLARKEFKNAQEDEKIRSSEEKVKGAAAGAEAGAGTATTETTKLVPPNHHAEKMAKEMDGLFTSQSMLHGKNDRGQSEAAGVLYMARGLKDPDKPELATLPTEQRQKFVAQLAAVMVLAEGKELGKVNLDAEKDGVTVRSKVTALLAQEVERDPAFLDKAKDLVKGYESAGLITEKQAEQVTELLAAQVVQKSAPEAQAGTAAEAVAAPDASSTAKPDQAPAAAQEAPQPSAQEVQQAPAAEAPMAPPEGVDLGKPTRELIDAASEPGKKPDGNLVAETLLSAEELRHNTVAALDNRTGDEPTKTLEKLEAIVQDALKGKYGEESQLIAEDTQHLVARWKLEDAERVAQEGGAKPAQGDQEKVIDAAQPVSPAPAHQGEAAAPAQKASGASAAAPGGEKEALASNPPAEAGSGAQKDVSASTPAATDGAAKEASVATGPEAAPAAEKQPDVRAEAAPQEQQVASPKEAAGTAALGAEASVPQAQETAQPSAVAADKPAAAEQPAFDPDREAKQQRFAETEIAAGKLAMLMDNPAGSFTNRDKSWNEGKIQEAADLVMRLDPDSVSQMSPKQRGAVMEYGSWLAMNAHSEKLPGFDSPDGKAKAEAMANHVAEIIGKFEGPTEVSSSVAKSLEKADRLVVEKERMSVEAERSGVATPEAAGSAPTKRQAAESFAKDLVHMVYQKSELTEADVKYAMKGASQLTPQTMKQLPPDLKAQATTALEFLAKEVRDGGALGDFSSLPPALKKNVIGAQQVVNTLNADFSRDSKVSVEMIKAAEALPSLGGAGSSAESAKAPAKGMDQGAGQDQVKSAGRELDR